MSNQRTCPHCGEALDPEEEYCSNCGEHVALPPVAPSVAPTVTAPTAAGAAAAAATAGGRNNIMGDNVVNAQDQSTTHNIDNSQTSIDNRVNNVTNTNNSVSNTSSVNSVDNSHRVVNNQNVTYNIVYQAGAPLPGGIPIPDPSQGAPAAHSAPAPAPASDASARPAAPASDGTAPQVKRATVPPVILPMGGGRKAAPAHEVPPAAKSGAPAAKTAAASGSKTWLWAGIAVVAIGIAVWAMGGSDKPAAPVAETPAVQEAEPAPAQQPAAKAPAKATPAKKAASAPKAAPAPAQPQTDANYEAGMKAFAAGEGLEAVSRFQASGSADALYMLGLIYEQGCGNIGADPLTADKYYRKAAALGSTKAKAKL